MYVRLLKYNSDYSLYIIMYMYTKAIQLQVIGMHNNMY